MSNAGTQIDFPSRLQVLDAAEVCVVGGGIAGVVAALCCAAAGVETVLVEERGALGWEVSHGLQIFLSGGTLPATWQLLVDQLTLQNAARGRTLDVCALECLLDGMLVRAGVRVHFRAFCSAVDLPAGVARVTTKSGPLALTAGFFVDATEHSRLARHAGARFAPAPPAEGPTHTRSFLLCAVTPPAEAETFSVDGMDRVAIAPTLWPDEALVSIFYRATDAARAEGESRFLIARTVDTLRRTHPGFEEANISLSAHEPFLLTVDTIDRTTVPDRLFVAGPSVFGRLPLLEERASAGEQAAAALLDARSAQPAPPRRGADA